MTFTLIVIMLVIYPALVWRGEQAPIFLWRLMWLPIATLGLLLMYIAFFMCGERSIRVNVNLDW